MQTFIHLSITVFSIFKKLLFFFSVIKAEDVDNDAADYSDENVSVSMAAAQNGFQRLNKQKFVYQGSLNRDDNRRY